jgi:hypothetical protein
LSSVITADQWSADVQATSTLISVQVSAARAAASAGCSEAVSCRLMHSVYSSAFGITLVSTTSENVTRVGRDAMVAVSERVHRPSDSWPAMVSNMSDADGEYVSVQHDYCEWRIYAEDGKVTTIQYSVVVGDVMMESEFTVETMHVREDRVDFTDKKWDTICIVGSDALATALTRLGVLPESEVIAR